MYNKVIKFTFAILVIITSLGVTGCNNESVNVSLDECIGKVQSDSENSLYQVKTKDDTDENYLDDLGLDTSKVKDSAVSICLDSKAYCLAIIETNNTKLIGEQLDIFAEKKADQLYKEHYEESLLAKQYTIKYIDNYVVFAMCEDSKDTCELLENSLILSMNNSK